MNQSTLYPFCQLAAADIVAENAFHVVIRDRSPVSLGHSLIIPKRHVASLFEFTAEEFNGAMGINRQL
ncbi:HIT family protein [Thiothrix subterranea]|uniref:HIT domain-containing protein n=1 Tax=Thiothrix subterranea TaxID=2735563 RepID=A0AA51R2I2_9GAMM|nr:HIT domain-containing protein [Thiothrix subterranea]WML87864.1 HIT domain-containing protein [Thiothrix subterranea]